MFALILAVDAILVIWGQPGIPLSDNDVKGIAGVTFVIIAIYMLIKARKQIGTRSTKTITKEAADLLAVHRAV